MRTTTEVVCNSKERFPTTFPSYRPRHYIIACRPGDPSSKTIDQVILFECLFRPLRLRKGGRSRAD